LANEQNIEQVGRLKKCKASLSHQIKDEIWNFPPQCNQEKRQKKSLSSLPLHLHYIPKMKS